MEEENSYGLITAPTMDNSIRIIFMVLASMSGLMVELMMENGLITRWKALELSLGQMVGDTKDNTLMIKNTVKAHLSGQTVVNILVNGTKANSMVSEPISKMVKNALVSGTWVNVLHGSIVKMEAK